MVNLDIQTILSETDSNSNSSIRTRHSRCYYRYVRHKTISRKKKICRNVLGFDWYKTDGKYSKNKIHCSCGLCKPRWIPTYRDIKEAAIYKSELKDLEESYQQAA